MRCEPCHGSGQIKIPPTPATVTQGARILISWRVCPECRGTGVVSCCEGFERDAGVPGVDAPAMCEGRRSR